MAIVMMVGMLVPQGAWAQELIFIDGSEGFENEGPENLIDGDDNTKWCSYFDYNNPPYIIFRTDETISISGYALVHGGDTWQYNERAWAVWTIYGANFAHDEDATRDSKAWKVVDRRSAEYDQDDFSFRNLSCDGYQYYMIVVEEHYTTEKDDEADELQQMAEIHFYFDRCDHLDKEYHEATDPTCTEAGTIDHYECSICHAKFDVEGNPISSITDEYRPADGHISEEGYCAVCGEHLYSMIVRRKDGRERTYYSLAEATDYIRSFLWDGAILTLYDDLELKENVNVPLISTSFTIDLNGHSITGVGDNKEFCIEGRVSPHTLTIVDSSDGKKGKIINCALKAVHNCEPEDVNAEIIISEGVTIEQRLDRLDYPIVYMDQAGRVVNHGDIAGMVKVPENCSFINYGRVNYVYFIGNYEELGSLYPIWLWSDDGTEFKVLLNDVTYNSSDPEYKYTSYVKTAPTCLESGVLVATGRLEYDDYQQYTDSREFPIPALGHSYTNKTLTDGPVADGLYAYACDNGCGQGDEHRFIKDFNGAGNHLELTEDGEGNYSTSEDITLADANGFVSPVSFAANSVVYTRQMTNEWGTIVLPFAINYDADNTNYNLYQLTAASSDDLTFTEYASGTIPAGTPMAVKAIGMKNDAGKYVITLTAAGNAVSAVAIAPSAEVGGLTMNGTYTALTDQTNVYFIAQNMFWWAEAPISIAPFRAWFNGGAPSNVKSLNIHVEEADGIAEISNANGMLNGKFMENGRVVIVKHGKKFNLNGQEIF